MFTATKEDTMQDLKGSARNFKNGSPELAHSTTDDLQEMAHKAGRKVQNYFNNAYNEVAHSTEAVTTQIRKSLVQSSMIALGLGVLLGALFRR